MPTVEQNRSIWNDQYQWPQAGDEWSKHWGGTTFLWFGVIVPRIHRFLPASTILEIAPGFGRWTQYLKDQCQRLIIVDMSPRCIQTCRQRFSDSTNITYHVNDGRSLEMIADGSVDFVFSFDSLVHAEAEVMRCYLRQIARKLRKDGVGFLHHSNIGHYRRLVALTKAVSGVLPYRVGKLLRMNVLINSAWRGEDMTSDAFRGFCRESGLCCISQELLNWENRRWLIDCFSVFTPSCSVHARASRILLNSGFMREARQIKRLAGLYS